MWSSSTGVTGAAAVPDRSADRATFNPALKGTGPGALSPTLLRAEKKDMQGKLAGGPPLANGAGLGKGPRGSGWTPSSIRSPQVISTTQRNGSKGQGRGEEASNGKGEVVAFLQSMGLSQHTSELLRNGFDDMDTLMHIEDGDMREIGLPACHVVKLRRRLQDLLRQTGEGGPELDESNPVVVFLKDIGLSQYAEALLRQGFDELETLMDIEDSDMKDMGIPRGHAVKLKRRLREYQCPEKMNQGFLTRPAVPSCRPAGCVSTAARFGSLPSDEMKSAVERSWEQVQAIGTYAVAELLYQHTFQIAPEVMSLFSPDVVRKYREWDPVEVGDDESYESPALRKLFSKYMNAVGCTVAGLHDFSRLVPMLRALGARHIGYGVHERHWPILGEAMILTLRDVLEDSFTSEVESAWTMVYGFMSNIMIEGLRSAIAARESLPAPGGNFSPALSEKTLNVAGQDDDTKSQGSTTTGLPDWQRQTTDLSEETVREVRLDESQPAGL